METTPRSRSSLRGRPIRAECGSTCARQAIRRVGAAGGRILLLARSSRRASPGALGHLTGIFQADACRGYGKLYEPGPSPGLSSKRSVGSTPDRRPFFSTANERPSQSSGQDAGANLAPGAGSGPPDRNALFDLKPTINGQSAEKRKALRRVSARRSSPIWRPGCESNAPSSRAGTTSPRSWTTCSSAGPSSCPSLTTTASVCRIMPPREACAKSPCMLHRRAEGSTPFPRC